jgi:hypothetical protein
MKLINLKLSGTIELKYRSILEELRIHLNAKVAEIIESISKVLDQDIDREISDNDSSSDYHYGM